MEDLYVKYLCSSVIGLLKFTQVYKLFPTQKFKTGIAPNLPHETYFTIYLKVIPA